MVPSGEGTRESSAASRWYLECTIIMLSREIRLVHHVDRIYHYRVVEGVMLVTAVHVGMFANTALMLLLCA